jgi:hypothetical protein
MLPNQQVAAMEPQRHLMLVQMLRLRHHGKRLGAGKRKEFNTTITGLLLHLLFVFLVVVRIQLPLTTPQYDVMQRTRSMTRQNQQV